jgi:hypothetical protein
LYNKIFLSAIWQPSLSERGVVETKRGAQKMQLSIRKWPRKLLGLIAVLSSFGGLMRPPKLEDGFPESIDGTLFGMGENVRLWVENQKGKAVGKEWRLPRTKDQQNV